MKSQFTPRTLHVHVSFAQGVDGWHKNDVSVPGVYAAEVGADLPEGLAAWAALQAFHEKVAISQPEDYEIAVFDPDERQYIAQVEPEDEQEISYQFMEKVAEVLPRTTLRLTLDVTYTPECRISSEVLKKLIESQVEKAVLSGMLTGHTAAQVDEHSFVVDEVVDEPEALLLEEPINSRTEYKLSNQVNSCWITVDTAGINIARTEAGVFVDIVANDGSATPLASAAVSYDEIEGHVCADRGVAIEDVEVQYDFEHPQTRGFQSLSRVDRMPVILETSRLTAKAATAIAKTSVETHDDESSSWELSQLFAGNSLV